ncbi:MAG: amidase [Rhodospirillaceae bacterium]|nr:amidase [Rhodospirillaceae bacterium]
MQANCGAVRELSDLSLTAAAALIRAGTIAALDLVETSLAAIAQWQPAVNAFLAVEGDAARAAARSVDARRARGEPLGPLAGVPLAHKDLFERAGRKLTAGSIILDSVPTKTATVLARLDAAGAIDLGPLHLSEFAAGATGHNRHFGPCRNPWRTERIPGGSSGGSAAAVAAGMILGSLGTDTGGSLRLPAHFCGVAALRPTYGRVGRGGVFPRAWSMDAVGPMARHVEDLAALLQVIAGPEPGDSTAEDRPVPDYGAALGMPFGGIRIGVPENFFFDRLDPGIGNLIDAARREFERIGARVVPVRVPDPAGVFANALVLATVEAAAIHRHWLAQRPGDYDHGVREAMIDGLSIAAIDYAASLDARRPARDEWLATAFAAADLLLTPVYEHATPTMAEADPARPGAAAAMLATFGRCTRPFSYLGFPALALPCGFQPDGMPAALQLVGMPWQEAQLLAAGHCYQQATAWHRTRPAPAAIRTAHHAGSGER